MASSIDSEIYVFPQFCNAIRSSPDSTISAGNNYYLEIHVLAKHSYPCGDNIVEECQFGNKWGCKYKSLSWDFVDRELLAYDFSYSLEKVKWDGTDKNLKSKNDVIQQILEFARTVQNITPPFQDDDKIYVSLTFVKKVFVSPQEFELTKENILFKHYERIGKIHEEINGLGRGLLSLYEEFQYLEGYVETVVRDTTNWRTMYFDKNYERTLIESLTKASRKEFMLLSAVKSRMQYLRAINLSKNELKYDCSICMSGYSPSSEAYNLPCSHSFHFGCIETWLLKNPSCPMCRLKLPPTV